VHYVDVGQGWQQGKQGDWINWVYAANFQKEKKINEIIK
jgi:hypothetical protein